MEEVERVKANLKASDTEIALSAKKYREVEAKLKEAEAQALGAKTEVTRLEKALQSKSDALTSLDGLGQRSKEVLGVIHKLQTASDAMESAVTCLHCLGHLPSSSILLKRMMISLIASSVSSSIKCGFRLSKVVAVVCLNDLMVRRSLVRSMWFGISRFL